MEEILENLARVAGVRGCLIAGRDGLLIAQAGRPAADPELAGAILADLMTTTEGAFSDKLGGGLSTSLMVEGAEAILFLQVVSDSAFLAAFARPASNVGLVRWEVRSAAEKLKDVL